MKINLNIKIKFNLNYLEHNSSEESEIILSDNEEKNMYNYNNGSDSEKSAIG